MSGDSNGGRLAEGAALPRLPFAYAKRHGVVLTSTPMPSHQVEVACRQRPALSVLAEVKRVARRELVVKNVTDAEFERLITDAYSRDSSQARQMVEDMDDEINLLSLAEALPQPGDLLEQEDDAPIIRLINALLAEAIRESASDIHIETFERSLVVRFRVDGVMREVVQPRRELAPLLVSRIKVMARLDIAEKRVPQDGRISVRIGGREVDVRVSTMPASSGERVVMRLLDKQAGRLKLGNLGMSAERMDVLRRLVHLPHGIFLVTGPTGSGKTTTLYASLAELDASAINVLTVEDPIEYNLPGIGQTQVNTKADMTFARGLRAILRQDPDVVMVGEIRDLETAEVAVQASLTGHLVLSTLHTNTAVGAISRLVDMGVEPFLLSSSIVGVLAQRLVRVLCQDCKRPRIAGPSELRFLGVSRATVHEPGGCEACGHSGYRGRTGIYELIPVDETFRQLVHDRVSEQELTAYVRRKCPGIRADGVEKVLAGVTTVQEVLRVSLEQA
ncbi:MAG: type II secretion system ATPase GspE [Pseudomonadales bacterium]